MEVIGIDISPQMKPDDTPGNFWPELDDINETLLHQSNKFDLVQSRMVGGGINASRWSSYMRDIKRVLKPGGWLQMIECYFMCQSNNGSITDAHPIRRWSNKYIESLSGIKDPRAPLRLQSLFNAAGFVEIEHRMIQLPLCGWPDGMSEGSENYIYCSLTLYLADDVTDSRERRIGEENRDNIQQALSTLAIYPFTSRLGMSIQEVRALVASARVDAANPKLKAYFPLWVWLAARSLLTV
ncbi:hypothetical protein ACLMJK_005121 [Lecanora helva]